VKRPSTPADLDPAQVCAGVVATVNAARGTVAVRLEVGARTIHNVQVGPVGYGHVGQGAGGFALPDVGAHVWVTFPSDASGLPFISNYRSLPDQRGNFRGASDPPRAGEQVILSAEGAGLLVRRGAAVELRSGPTCRILVGPGRIALCAERGYRMISPNLQVYADTLTPEESPEGDTLGRLDLIFRRAMADTAPALRLRAGECDDMPAVAGGDTAAAAVTLGGAEIAADVEGNAQLAGALAVGRDPSAAVPVLLSSLAATLATVLEEMTTAIVGLGGTPPPSAAALVAALRAGDHASHSLSAE
jgi:hypothetical protein